MVVYLFNVSCTCWCFGFCRLNADEISLFWVGRGEVFSFRLFLRTVWESARSPTPPTRLPATLPDKGRHEVFNVKILPHFFFFCFRGVWPLDEKRSVLAFVGRVCASITPRPAQSHAKPRRPRLTAGDSLLIWPAPRETTARVVIPMCAHQEEKEEEKRVVEMACTAGASARGAFLQKERVST